MVVNQAAYDAMRGYFNSQPKTVPGPDATKVANFILLNAQRNTLGPGNVNPNSPSILGRIFDILSRPNYAIANYAKGLAEGHDSGLADIISGLAGTQKTTFSDALKAAGLPDTGKTDALGLGLDIGLDPTTYLGGAGIASKLKDLGKAKGLIKDIPKAELPLGGKLLAQGEPVNPENFGLAANPTVQVPEALKALPTEGPVKVPQLVEDLANTAKPAPIPQQLELALPGIKQSKVTLPKLAEETSVPPVGSKVVNKEVKGQIPLKFPGFNLAQVRKATELGNVKKAEDIVKGISQGNIEDALKIAPPPPIKYSPRDARLAEEIVNKFDPYKATARINKEFKNTLNAKQQVKLYYQAREVLSKQGPKSALRTNAVYKAIEDTLVKRGLVPRIGTGENVKLSDVISHLKATGQKADYSNLKEFASSINRATPVGQAVEALRARGAIKDSVPVRDIVDKISESKAQTTANNLLSDVQLKSINKLLKKIGRASAQVAGVSPAGQKATEGLVTHAMNAGKSTAQVMLEQKSRMLDDIVAGGKSKRADINNVVTHGLEKDLGKLPKWVIGDNNKAVEFAMGRLATWWGQKDLRPATLEALASSAATAQLRGKVLDNLFKPFNPQERAEGMRLAQGIGQASSPATLQLGTKIAQIMSDLTAKAGGASVLVRSSVDRDMLNKWMRKYGTGFEFTNKSLPDLVTKEPIDFSKGADWLDSWKAAEIKDDPAQWIFKVQQAIEQATREKSVYDELGERFGSRVAGNGYRIKIKGHSYLEDYFFTEDIAKQIPRMVKDWGPSNLGNNQFLKLYDRGLSMWKTNVTIYKPGFHVRNIVGDMYLGALDGVTSIKPYRLALRVQRSMHGAYQDLNDIDRLVEIGAASKSMRTPMPGEILFRNKSGVGFTAEQIAAVAHQKGLFESFKTLEDIISTGEGKGKSILRPFGGKVQEAAGNLSELQHGNGRLAHFIDKVMKSRGSDLPKIFEEAARRSRKFHPSGLDMTEFEKKYLRRIMPFYSWLRKSTPLLLEGIVMRPGITVLPAKISGSIQEMAGMDTTRDNPFPVDQMFPSWLREQGLGPWGASNSLLGKFSNQSPPGYVMGGVGLDPLSGLISQLQHPGKTLGSGLTPGLKIPIELMTGTNIFTGAPITGPDAQPGALQQYIGEQVPLVSMVQSLTGLTPFGTETKANQRSGSSAMSENLINFLTGAGIKGTGPYIKSAQYEAQAPLKQQRKQAQNDFLAQFRNQ